VSEPSSSDQGVILCPILHPRTRVSFCVWPFILGPGYHSVSEPSSSDQGVILCLTLHPRIKVSFCVWPFILGPGYHSVSEPSSSDQGVILCLTILGPVSNKSLSSRRLNPQSHLDSQGSSQRQGGGTVENTNTTVKEMWDVQVGDGRLWNCNRPKA